jgi:anti-sigma regulatory factor (Ser/Thr protein kinase)
MKPADTGGTDVPRVSLKIPARPENVAVVRQALNGLADSMRLENGVLTNMKVAVTEACANVVVHAYEKNEGDMELEIVPQDTELTVVVRDAGSGFRPRVSIADDASWRLGMPLIASLTDALEVGQGPCGRGTEVRMKFAVH